MRYFSFEFSYKVIVMNYQNQINKTKKIKKKNCGFILTLFLNLTYLDRLKPILTDLNHINQYKLDFEKIVLDETKLALPRPVFITLVKK